LLTTDHTSQLGITSMIQNKAPLFDKTEILIPGDNPSISR